MPKGNNVNFSALAVGPCVSSSHFLNSGIFSQSLSLRYKLTSNYVAIATQQLSNA